MSICYSEAVKVYLSHCETEKRNGTTWLNFQRATLFKFMAFLHERGIRALGNIQPFHLTDFLAERAHMGESAASRTRRGVIIRAVARWCEHEGRIEACPLSRAVIKNPKRLPTELPAKQRLDHCWLVSRNRF